MVVVADNRKNTALTIEAAVYKLSGAVAEAVSLIHRLHHGHVRAQSPGGGGGGSRECVCVRGPGCGYC